jgi:hypothetical protein
MKVVKLTEKDLEKIFEKIISEEKGLPQSFGFNMVQDKKKSSRDRKIDILSQKFLPKFDEIAKEYGEDVAIEAAEELLQLLVRKYISES